MFTGCAGYRLGPTQGQVAGGQSVEVHFFENATFEPRLSTTVNQVLRRTLQQDGTLRLAPQGEGDIVLSGRITGYQRQGVTYEPDDVITVRDFDILVSAQVKATERSTGKVLFDRRFGGRQTVRVEDDQTMAERQALPMMAQDLARNITAALVEGEW